METDTPAAPSKRPRPILLVLLGVVVAAFLLMQLGGGSTGPRQSTSNAPRVQQRPQQAATGEPLDPSKLDVHLEALREKRPDPGASERNPFRFQPKAPPPSPAPLPVLKPAPVEPIGPPPPPPPPPITIKFIGTLETADGAMRAMLTDCTAGHQTKTVKEGETVFGQYRLVKIGLESVVVEHVDGRGRTTLAKNGQECVWKQ